MQKWCLTILLASSQMVHDFYYFLDVVLQLMFILQMMFTSIGWLMQASLYKSNHFRFVIRSILLRGTWKTCKYHVFIYSFIYISVDSWFLFHWKVCTPLLWFFVLILKLSNVRSVEASLWWIPCSFDTSLSLFESFFACWHTRYSRPILYIPCLREWAIVSFGRVFGCQLVIAKGPLLLGSCCSQNISVDRTKYVYRTPWVLTNTSHSNPILQISV